MEGNRIKSDIEEIRDKEQWLKRNIERREKMIVDEIEEVGKSKDKKVRKGKEVYNWQ